MCNVFDFEYLVEWSFSFVPTSTTNECLVSLSDPFMCKIVVLAVEAPSSWDFLWMQTNRPQAPWSLIIESQIYYYSTVDLLHNSLQMEVDLSTTGDRKSMCVNQPQIIIAQLHKNKPASSGSGEELTEGAKKSLPTEGLCGELKQRRLQDLSCWKRC